MPVHIPETVRKRMSGDLNAASKTPNEVYLKSRRALVAVSGLLLLAVWIGVVPDSSDGSVTFFSLKIRTADSIPSALFVALIYTSWQYWSSWFVQADAARNFIVNRVDVVVTLSIAILSAGVFLWPHIRRVFSYNGTWTGIVGGFLGLLAGAAFQYSNTYFRRRLVRTVREMSAQLSLMLTASDWILNFNPQATNGSKRISFLKNGEIGEGRNDNENRWRIQDAVLEILNSNGRVFSRFSYKKDSKVFEHTNDADTLSLRDQTIRQAIKPDLG